MWWTGLSGPRSAIAAELSGPEPVALHVLSDLPDPLRGARIVAAVTHEVNEKKLLRALAEELPAISLPKQFVVLGEFPKMGSGKIDFRTITELAREIVQGK